MAVVALAAGVHLVVGDLKLEEIAKHIAQAEAKTTGEIVCVLAKQADDYRYIPVLWAAILALLVPLVFLVMDFVNAGANWGGAAQSHLYIVYMAQMLVFLAAFLVVQYAPVKFKLVPKYIMTRRANRLAVEQFMMEKIHLTDKRTGVLLFISMAERYVVVIADHGINAKLDDGVWQEIVDKLIADIKAKRMSEGIIAAVDELGALLETHFPADGEANENELPNHLILLD